MGAMGKQDNAPLSHFLSFVQHLLDRIEHASNKIVPALIFVTLAQGIMLFVDVLKVCN